MVGQIAGHYQILEKLGEGGMGEVFKARDIRLNRFVAIKSLAPDRVSDAERRARFIQEARAASALNHPNIVTIHEVVSENGSDFIVMEYIAGETLAQRIASKDLRLTQILKIAPQIADALACAHAAGIVHRDLKPSNIMIGEDGIVKVLDFGLAKLRIRPASLDGTTETMPKTGQNMVLGTVGYMSPEQVRGKEVDHRSDIFSLGLVLYEMLSGTRAFQGESSIEVMNSVLKEEPRPLSDTVPPALRQIVTDCLEKAPSARFESARDLALALRAISTGPGTSAASPAIGPSGLVIGKRWIASTLGAAVLALGLSTAALYWSRPEPLDLSTYRFKPVATEPEPETEGSWSPDGKSIVYLKRVEGQQQVMVRSLDASSPTQLTRIPGGVISQDGPFFSPDGERVYFVNSGSVWTVAAMGGEPQQAIDAPTISSAAISPDGKTMALWRRYEESGKRYASVWISSPPGAPPRKYEPAPFQVEIGFVPDFLRFSRDGTKIGLAARVVGEAWLWVLPWPDGAKARPRRIFSDFRFREVPAFDWMPDSRHLVLSGIEGLWMGDSISGGFQRLTANPIGRARHPSVSPDGRRVLFAAEITDHDLIELPLDGSAPRPILATSRDEASPSWSAAGDIMAFITDRSGESEIWLRNVASGWERPVVRQGDFGDGEKQLFVFAVLSPDGKRIASSRRGRTWISPASGGRPSQLATGGDNDVPGVSWSPDGSSLACLTTAQGNRHLAVAGVGSPQPPRLVGDTANQCNSAPVWSPDGRWIACGTVKREVLLVSPDGRQRRCLPSPAGAAPYSHVLVFSKDGSALYLASSGDSRARMDRIDLQTGKSRRIAEYQQQLEFEGLQNFALGGSLAGDGKSFATTVVNRKADLWILEGFPQPRRRWW